MPVTEGTEALPTDANGVKQMGEKDAAAGTLHFPVRGVPITGQTLETGGGGGLGWLSSIRKAITTLLGNADDTPVADPNAVTASLLGLTRGVLQRVLLLAGDATLTGGTQKTRVTDGTTDVAVGTTTPASGAAGMVVRPIPGTSLFLIVGSQASGAVATDNPVVMAGVDGAGLISRLPVVDGAIPVSQIDQQQRGALVNRSGTITAGGTAQQVAAANAPRRYLLVQNVSDTDMWVNFGTIAVAGQPSISLKANGGNMVMEGFFVSNEFVSIICATTGKAFTAKEYP